MDLMTAQEHTEALGGEWYGHHGRVACPVCQPERRPDQRALSIRDGGSLFRFEVFCHGEGCEPERIVSALHGLQACGIRYIQDLEDVPRRRDQQPPHEREAWLEERRRCEERSSRLWDESEPLDGSPVEAYLRGLGITCPLPSGLRYHNACWHPFDVPRPAMVALLDEGPWKMLNASYLPIGDAWEATTKPADVYLGAVGRLVPVVEVPAEMKSPFVVVERLESALALASADLLPSPANILAALSAEGLEKPHLPERYVKGWFSPAEPGRVLIASEGTAISRRAAHQAANRAKAAGWEVTVLSAPEGARWTDVLAGRVTLPDEDQPRIRDFFNEREVLDRSLSDRHAWAEAEDDLPF